MNEPFKHQHSPDESHANTDVVTLIRKMQQQLDFLERKIDTLISQSQGRPAMGRPSPERSFRDKRFSKPFRPSGPSHQHGKTEHYGSRPRAFGQGQRSDRRPDEPEREFNPKKKPFFFKRKERR